METPTIVLKKNQGGVQPQKSSTTGPGGLVYLNSIPTKKSKWVKRKPAAKGIGKWVGIMVLEPAPQQEIVTGKKILDIVYWCFAVLESPDGPIHGAPDHYWHQFFENSSDDVGEMAAIIASQPTINGEGEYEGQQVPLHAYSNARLFSNSSKTRDENTNPLMPDIVPDNKHSVFFMVSNVNWSSLTARQKQERLTQEAAVWAAGQLPPERDQILNLLSNLVPDLSMIPPVGWGDVATHELAHNFLRTLEHVPLQELCWPEVKWSIFANKSAMTWLHNNILFTVITIPCGEELWWVGRCKPEIMDGHGDPRSWHCLDGFKGWKSMSAVYDFEAIHLDPYVTLYMPATTLHTILTMEDTIGTGMHGVPGSNGTNCIITILHNLIADQISTNTSHEEA
ncbi:hypothetical protein B0H16DRAFT_1740700 [Mycena metata]|uniref:Uncharacterized protein n=1 Tax=Mycena metata TaxID=1033252 RepID=A0AAD7HBY2_9AGAR|nr:hypothetical protein B0H16DRAFT_1740700 [Mycena metata]